MAPHIAVSVPVTKLARPPLVEERLLAIVDGEWRTAREIYAIFDEGELSTIRSTLSRLANAEKIERRHDPHPNITISRYRLLPTEQEQPCPSKS
jgi:hypothetical protein